MSAANYHANIRSGIRQRLQTLPGLIAVAWEGRTYQPVKGTPFLTEQFRPISSAVRATGVGLPYAVTVSVFGGTAEPIALWFKTSGFERGFYYYLTGVIAVSLLVYVSMRDTRRHSAMARQA